MIEALESFQQGVDDTTGKSGSMFTSFFNRVDEFSSLATTNDFYDKVRCGILHQAETKSGWRIHRNGPLFDETTLTINATEFLRGMENYLHDYKKQLISNDWGSEIWQLFRKKMDFIIRNCEPLAQGKERS